MNAKHRVFDDKITTWIQSWPVWLNVPMLAITNAGQPLTVILFAIAMLVWAARQQYFPMMLASIIILATVITSSGLKLLWRRARPLTDYVAKMVYHTYSFPSGHSTAATVGFGFVAYLAIHALWQPWGIVLAVAAIIFGSLVCISRIYLGAHYPTDVLAGIALGLVGLMLIFIYAKPFA